VTYSPIAYAGSVRIGSVDFVSPDEIRVLLDVEAPNSVAMNTGEVRPFPRINGYVLIPSDEGALVAQVEWITVERSQYPKRRGLQDFGLVDLPYPLRKMSLNPLGTLVADGTGVLRFRRGVDAYPTVGDPVWLPTQKQLRAIVESGDNRWVKIGTSPLAANAAVSVDPDRLFGRHLAVLGNTGSGKSCSVAGLIRWSLEAAGANSGAAGPNARFVVLDPNGEYAATFEGLGKVRVFAVEPTAAAEQLCVPIWFWNSAEWTTFTQASVKTQRPTLVQALRTVRDRGAEPAQTPSHDIRRRLRTFVTIIRMERNAGSPWASYPRNKSFCDKLKAWRDGLETPEGLQVHETDALADYIAKLDELIAARSAKYPVWDFSPAEVDELLELASAAHLAFGGSDLDVLPIDADVPRPFTGDEFVRSLEANAELAGVSEYVETMLMRVRTLLADTRMRAVAQAGSDVSLADWLSTHLGAGDADNGSITVIDLSLLPSQLIHLVTAVVARMTLEALQRYRKLNDGKTLPTVLVMEEAHTFIKRYADNEENPTAATVCAQVFEKIAREGRKFGLGLVLSSQRPSELSPTVLSQCNTYLLHRISNDRDQELVHKLVPDNLRGLLRDMPSLPSRHAILLGWASELPVLVEMNHLDAKHRPRSDDPDFWNVWSRQTVRAVDWKRVADDWQQVAAPEVPERGAAPSRPAKSQQGATASAGRRKPRNPG